MTAAPTVGIEEEYFLVDPDTREPQAAGPRVVARAATDLGASVSGEFTQYQVEVKTPPCLDADQLRTELGRLRASVVDASHSEGVRLCASGTPVVGAPGRPLVGDHARYRAGVAQYRRMLDDFIVCSQHVHVHLPDRELAVRVSNHLRPWLPLLVAISANSPFYEGNDTGYASWRAVIRARFPCLGPPPYAESLCQHEQLAASMVGSGAMLDTATPFWDVRLNPHVPTLEIRTMDVTADVDDAVALAVLLRALVTTATAKARAGDQGPRLSSELLRAAYWRAARDGWTGCSVDALTGSVLPAPVQARRLVDYVRAYLDEHGDTQNVEEFLRRLVTRGSGAERQRQSLTRHGSVTGIVDDLIALTART